MAAATDTAIDRLQLLLVSPTLLDLILVFTLIEAAILGVLRGRTQRGLSLMGVARMLLPGVFLLLAARAALSGAAWPWLPTALAASLIAHLIDLRYRWRH